MNKKDLAMYDAFQRLLHEDGHLKRTDIFAFRLGWLECQAAQQSVQLTGGTLPDFQADSTPEDLSGLEADTTPPTSN